MQRKKFIGIFYKIFRGNYKKSYAFLVSTIYLSIDDKTEAKPVDLSPKWFFWTYTQPFVTYFLLGTCNVCRVAIQEIFAQRKDPVNGNSFITRYS